MVIVLYKNKCYLIYLYEWWKVCGFIGVEFVEWIGYDQGIIFVFENGICCVYVDYFVVIVKVLGLIEVELFLLFSDLVYDLDCVIKIIFEDKKVQVLKVINVFMDDQVQLLVFNFGVYFLWCFLIYEGVYFVCVFVFYKGVYFFWVLVLMKGVYFFQCCVLLKGVYFVLFGVNYCMWLDCVVDIMF